MKTDLRLRVASLAACVLLAGAGCDQPETSKPALPATAAQQDLLMGYELLADTLAEESQLGALKVLKKLTFRGPVEEVGEAMDAIGKASKRRGKELEELRKLAPDVTGEPAKRSPIGDAITAVAKDAGKEEMLGDSSFDLRFMLLQAQATRMVSAMASAIAQYEPNAERKKWLGEVAREYEGHRDDVIEDILKYIRGKGAAQQKD
jgi:hypothetical protein